jgi:carboxypeptidase family protein
MVTLGLGGLSLAAARADGQSAGAANTANATAYVDENSVDPAPLKLTGVEGRVRGLGGDPMPRTSVSLFTEDRHVLIATVMSDKDGKFRFNKVDKGLYRVVARLPGLCAANIPIKVESSVLAKHRIEITMQPKDLDKCSYGLAK